MLENYEINLSTLAVIPTSETTCKVIEEDRNFIVNKTANYIIDHSCKYFGSSYNGRCEGTKALLGCNYKLPIIVDEIREIIFFPTASIREGKSWWISLKQISKFEPCGRQSRIIFSNNMDLILSISYHSLENQIMRAIYLENALRNHRK